MVQIEIGSSFLSKPSSRKIYKKYQVKFYRLELVYVLNAFKREVMK